MVFAEDPLPVGEGLLQQGDGAAEVSTGLVRDTDITASGQGLGMVLAEDPLPVGENLLQQGDGAV